MTGISDAALTTITAALTDADLLAETVAERAARVAQYLLSSGYRITPDLDEAA